MAPWLALACAAPAVQAQGLIPPGEERFKLNLGGLLYRSHTEVRIDGRSVGTRFEIEDTLGLDHERHTVGAELVWRFASRHRLGLRVFQVDREAQRAIDRQLRIEDRVLPISTVLRAESRLQIFVADYRYSFIKNERMEIAGILGIHGGRYRFRFSATHPLIDIDRKTTAPVPVVGAGIDWFVTPRWTVSASVRGMEFDLDSVDARIVNVGLSTEYMLTRHFGLGLAYNIGNVRVDVDKSSFDGGVNLRGGSLMGFVQARF